MDQQFATLILETVKSAAMPVCCLAGAWLFHPQIKAIVDRVKTVQHPTLGSLTLESEAPAQIQNQPKSEPMIASVHDTSAPQYDSAFRTSMAELLEEHLKGVPPDQQRAYLFEFALNRITEYYLLENYLWIHGSQLRLLDSLASLPLGVELKPLKAEFEETYLNAYPKSYINGFDGWLEFLAGTGFVQHDETRVLLTPLGREFLHFVLAKGVSKNKPL